MTTTPNLSIENDFNGNFQPEYFAQFTEYVNNANTITADMLYISNMSGDSVTCQFDGSVSEEEEIILRALAGSFVYIVPIYYSNTDTFAAIKRKFNNTTYERVGIYSYAGNGVAQIIQSFTFIGFKESAITSYSVRLEDVTNGLTLCEATFSNNNIAANSLTTVTNVPTTPAILEAHVKRVGGTTANYISIHELTINI